MMPGSWIDGRVGRQGSQDPVEEPSGRLVYITLENRGTPEDACHIVHPLGFLFLSFIHFYTLMIAALESLQRSFIP